MGEISMKKLLLIGFFLLVPIMGTAYAESLQWVRNSEPDMKDYQVYACFTPSCVLIKSGSTLQPGNVSQPAAGVVPSFIMNLAGKEGSIGVLARDLSLNESALSVIPFDKTPPLSPANPQIVP